MGITNKGLLESINLRFEKSDGEDLKKKVDAARAVLSSIGSHASYSDNKK